MWQPAVPAFSSSPDGAGHVHWFTEAGVRVHEGGQVGHAGDLPGAGGDLGEGGQTDVGQAQIVGRDRAGDVDPGEALFLDQPGRERVERARELLHGAGVQQLAELESFLFGVVVEYSI